MNRSTILHPALLGHANRFGQEAKRIGQAAAQPGLFDLVDRDGQGPAHGAADALRTLQVLGEAYGLGPLALREWMATLSIERVPDTGSWKAHDIKARFNRPVADKALIRLLRNVVKMANAHPTLAATP